MSVGSFPTHEISLIPQEAHGVGVSVGGGGMAKFSNCVFKQSFLSFSPSFSSLFP